MNLDPEQGPIFFPKLNIADLLDDDEEDILCIATMNSVKMEVLWCISCQKKPTHQNSEQTLSLIEMNAINFARIWPKTS